MVSRCSPTVTSGVVLRMSFATEAILYGRNAISSWHVRWSEKFMVRNNLQLVGRSLRVEQPDYEEQDHEYDAYERHMLPILEPRFTRVSEPAV